MFRHISWSVAILGVFHFRLINALNVSIASANCSALIYDANATTSELQDLSSTASLNVNDSSYAFDVGTFKPSTFSSTESTATGLLNLTTTDISSGTYLLLVEFFNRSNPTDVVASANMTVSCEATKTSSPDVVVPAALQTTTTSSASIVDTDLSTRTLLVQQVGFSSTVSTVDIASATSAVDVASTSTASDALATTIMPLHESISTDDVVATTSTAVSTAPIPVVSAVESTASVFSQNTIESPSNTGSIFVPSVSATPYIASIDGSVPVKENQASHHSNTSLKEGISLGVVGFVLVLVVFVACIVFFCRRKGRQQREAYSGRFYRHSRAESIDQWSKA